MIRRAIAENFLSWERLVFTVQDGVTLIDGWNEDDQTPEGSGKSAVLNAISWCLYGRIPKDAKIDEVIKTGKKSCSVITEITEDTSVVRKRSPNDLYIEKNGQKIKGKDSKETQQMIEDLIGLSFETFCQTVYFAQNYDKKFITANQEEKAKILSEVQDLNLFDKARKEVQSLIKLGEEKLTSLRHEVDLLNKDIQLVDKDIEFEAAMINERKSQKERNIRNLDVRINEINTRLAAYGVQVDGLFATQNSLEVPTDDEFNAVQNEISTLRSEASGLQKQILDIDSVLRFRTQKEASGVKYGQRYKKLVQDKERSEDFIKNPSKDCPTCGTKLEGCDVSHAQKELSDIQSEMTEIMFILETISAELSEPAPSKTDLQDKLTQLNLHIANNNAKVTDMNYRKSRAVEVKAKISQLEVVATEAANSMIDLDKQKREMEASEVDVDDSRLLPLKEKQAALKSDVVSLSNLVDDQRAHLARLESLKDGYKEVKSYIFNSLLNEINSRVNQYLMDLFNVPASIRFTNDNMKIESEVVLNDVPRALGLLSGGQFRRFSLAVDLALSDTITSRKNSKLGILILDEYFKDLSENSMEKCLNLLQKRNQPVLLIEHNSVFKSIVDNSFFVTLKDGTSSAEI